MIGVMFQINLMDFGDYGGFLLKIENMQAIMQSIADGEYN